MKLRISLGSSVDQNISPRKFWIAVDSNSTINSLIHDIVDALSHPILSPDELELSCDGFAFLGSTHADKILDDKDTITLDAKKDTPKAIQQQGKPTADPVPSSSEQNITNKTSRSAGRKAAKRSRKRQGFPFTLAGGEPSTAVPNDTPAILRKHRKATGTHVHFDESDEERIITGQKESPSTQPTVIMNNTDHMTVHSHGVTNEQPNALSLPPQLRITEDDFRQLEPCKTGDLSIHDVVAYKLLEIDQDNKCPCISQPRLGRIISLNSCSSEGPTHITSSTTVTAPSNNNETVLTLQPYPDASIHPVTMMKIKEKPQQGDVHDGAVDTTNNPDTIYDESGVLHAAFSSFADIRKYAYGVCIAPTSYSKEGPPQPGSKERFLSLQQGYASRMEQVKSAAEALLRRRSGGSSRSTLSGNDDCTVGNAFVEVKKHDYHLDAQQEEGGCAQGIIEQAAMKVALISDEKGKKKRRVEVHSSVGPFLKALRSTQQLHDDHNAGISL